MHEPSIPPEPANPHIERYNAQLGLVLFLVYLLLYGAFVVINAAWPAWMDEMTRFGLNMAVVYGLGLIVGALVIALLYAALCKNPQQKEQA